MKRDNRRSFIRKSVIGLTGVAFAPGIIKRSSASFAEKAVATLPQRVLGRTGIKVPLISMGTSDATSTGIIKAACDAGIRLFFSATYYGEGKNEILVGEALKGIPRESFIIGTAVPPDGMDMKTGTFPNGFNSDAYIKKAEGSLKRFGFDYVDFILFPYAGKRETVMHEGVLKSLEQLKKQGKTRFLGIASHGDTEEALRAAADAAIYDVAMPAYNYKVQNKEAMNNAVAYAVKAGMGVVAMKTTAGAFYKKSGPELNTNAAFRWVLQNENISSIVSGMSTMEQLNKNLALLKDLKISDQDLKDLNLTAMSEETGLYCLQCKQCLKTCRHDLDIPTMMRSYMYAYGYKNINQAWNTLAQADYSGQCSNCSTCSVKCSSGFDVRKKILDISRLKDVPTDFVNA